MHELGLSQAQLGKKAFGRLDPSAIQSLKKGSSPSADRLAAIADALGWELYLGPPRHRGPGMSEEEAANDPTLAHSRFLPIPWHRDARRPGSAPVGFLPAWFDANALVPDHLAAVEPDAIEIDGIALHGPRGALIVLDTRPPKQTDHGIWCWHLDGRTTVGHCQFAPGATVLFPRELHQPARILLGDDTRSARILGRVVWISTTT
jgi:hypothetical protein